MKQYLRFHNFSPSQNLLFTFILITLGLGYMFAMIFLWETHSGLDGKSGLSAKDIAIAYRGATVSRLELALKGPMSDKLDKESRAKILHWIENGNDTAVYNSTIKPIVDTNCKLCHGSGNPHLPNLMTYDNLVALTKSSKGITIGTLVKVSHIHLFGLTFIFALTGIIFSFSYVKIWFKRTIIVLPFIGSWWITKVSESFAYVVIISGILMAIAFIIQFTISIKHMWFYTNKVLDIV